MKTLVVEAEPMRAQAAVALLGGVDQDIDVAKSVPQARLMLLSRRYDRLALRRGLGAAKALLAAARSANPDCEMIDLASMRVRSVSGPARADFVPVAAEDGVAP